MMWGAYLLQKLRNRAIQFTGCESIKSQFCFLKFLLWLLIPLLFLSPYLYDDSNTAWKVSLFGVILIRIFPHSDWIGEIRGISPYSVRMRENTDQNNSEYGHFLRSVIETRNVNIKILCHLNYIVIRDENLARDHFDLFLKIKLV